MTTSTKTYNKIVTTVRTLFESEEFIPLHEPRFIGNEKKYLNKVIDSTFVSSVGEYVNRFEKEIQRITGAKFAVATVNGTSALHVSLRLAGVKQGTEVLTQPFTFVATANAISYFSAVPHFVDIEPQNLGIDPEKLKKYLHKIVRLEKGKPVNKETGRLISACVPMHTFGFVSYIEEIISVCDEFNIPVVEDAAESLGSYSGMQHTGTFGKLGTLSLNGNKVVTSGGGGAIMTDDEELAKLAKHLTTTAKVPHKWDYVHNYTAYNYRMPNLNAALACAQLESLDRYLANKRDLVGEYANAFGSEVEILKEREGTTANYWLITLRFDSEKEKLAFLAFSNEKGVMTRPAWKLMNELDMYKNCPKSDLSMAQQQANLIVNIPSSVRV